jgi:putative chitobiose transport system permease protein
VTRNTSIIDRRPMWLTAILTLAAALLVLLAVGPAVWLVLVAFQPAGQDLSSIGGFTFANFEQAWVSGKLATPLINSVLVTLARTGLNVVLAALAAYPLARMKFRGRNTLFLLLLATLMLPEQVLVVPMFRIIEGLGMYDSLLAVIVPMSVSAMGVYLCRQALASIPDELEEAARIDGAGALRIWWHVMLPLIAPTLATLALFSFIGAWSDLLWPLVVLQDRENYTLPVAISSLAGQFSTNIRAAYAGAVIALLPVVTVFLLVQRWFKPELMSGSVKG